MSLTSRGSNFMRSILRSKFTFTETPQNVNKTSFRGVLVTITSEVKYDLIKFEPREVKLIFLLTSEIVLVFDFLTKNDENDKKSKINGNLR